MPLKEASVVTTPLPGVDLEHRAVVPATAAVGRAEEVAAAVFDQARGWVAPLVLLKEASVVMALLPA